MSWLNLKINKFRRIFPILDFFVEISHKFNAGSNEISINTYAMHDNNNKVFWIYRICSMKTTRGTGMKMLENDNWVWEQNCALKFINYLSEWHSKHEWIRAQIAKYLQSHLFLLKSINSALLISIEKNCQQIYTKFIQRNEI